MRMQMKKEDVYRAAGVQEHMKRDRNSMPHFEYENNVAQAPPADHFKLVQSRLKSVNSKQNDL
jgi:hypothetical protein